jgi:hypothetical protein
MKTSENKRIRFFTSFEEAERAEQEQKNKLSGVERLANTTLLIKKIYNYQPQNYFRIYFDNC